MLGRLKQSKIADGLTLPVSGQRAVPQKVHLGLLRETAITSGRSVSDVLELLVGLARKRDMPFQVRPVLKGRAFNGPSKRFVIKLSHAL